MLSPETVKSIRDHNNFVRHAYVAARRAVAWRRDGPRRDAVDALPSSDWELTRTRGYLVADAGRLAGADAVVIEAREALARFEPASTGGRNRKKFLMNVLDPSSVTADSVFIRFALQPDLVTVASRYLGLVPLLTHISVFHSAADAAPARSSQLFHCDAEDIHQVKVFVYATEVSERSGPLTLLDAEASERVQRSLRFRFNDHLTDEQVRGVLGEGAERPVLGSPGTVAIVDTSRCLHYGSRVAPDAPARLMVMFQYQTPYSFLLPHRYQDAVPFRRLINTGMTAIERLVLGA